MADLDTDMPEDDLVLLLGDDRRRLDAAGAVVLRFARRLPINPD